MIRYIKKHIVFFLGLISFLLLILILTPYLNITPALDQLVIYRESAIFYEQGLQGLIETGNPLHPPLIYILINIGFKLFGTSVLSYNLIGLSFLLLTLYLTLKLLKEYFSISTSLIITLLLLTNSIILLNYIYLSNDALILTGLIASLYLFIKDNIKALGITLAILPLFKESSILIIAIFFILYGFRYIRNKEQRKVKGYLWLLLPIFSFLLWQLICFNMGLEQWKEKGFDNPDIPSYLLIFNNVITNGIFNKFFLGNLYNAFIFNWQWVFSLISIPFVIFYLTKRKKDKNIKRYRFFLILSFISFIYAVLVFNYPTWTLIRYTLPIIPLMIFPIALILEKNTGIKMFLSSLLLIITINANINSNDPITLTDTPLTVESIDYYSKNVGYNGYMMVDYNLEYIKGLESNDKRIERFLISDGQIMLSNCIDVKTGEKIETISNYPAYFRSFPNDDITRKCLNYWEIGNLKEELKGKSIYIDPEYLVRTIELLNENNIAY